LFAFVLSDTRKAVTASLSRVDTRCEHATEWFNDIDDTERLECS